MHVNNRRYYLRKYKERQGSCMANIAVENAKRKYDELFKDEHIKALAFDKIAEKFYYTNFASVSKTDIDTMMFSIYLDRILDTDESDLNAYSDYTLSKLLGITQSKVSNLKVKKELLYPYEGFDWKKSFERIISNYRYEDGKIKLYIPDKNLYYELRNVIECAGGYVEVTLNATLLQVAPEYFVDILYAVLSDDQKEQVKINLIKTMHGNNIETLEFGKRSIGDRLKKCAPDIAASAAIELIGDFVPVFGSAVKVTLEKIKEELMQ